MDTPGAAPNNLPASDANGSLAHASGDPATPQTADSSQRSTPPQSAKVSTLRKWAVRSVPKGMQAFVLRLPEWAILTIVIVLLTGTGVIFLRTMAVGLEFLATAATDPVTAVKTLGPKPEAATKEELTAQAKEIAEIKRQFSQLLEATGGVPLSPEQQLRQDRAVGEIVADNDPVAALLAKGDLDGAREKLATAARAETQNAAAKWRQIGALFNGVDFAKAWEAYEEAFRLDPSDFWTCIEVARLRRQGGKLAEAQFAAEAAEKISGTDHERMVAANDAGNILSAEGDLGAAQARYEKGLAIAERLTRENPNSVDAQRDLSVSHNLLGDTLRAAGNLGGAQARYEEGLAIRERLAQADPNGADTQRDLSVSYNKLGDTLGAAGNLGAAQASYEKGLAISERLAREYPKNVDAQRDLSISYNKLGDILRAGGNLGTAQARYEQGLAISERLARENLKSADAQRDVSISYQRLGDTLSAAGNLGAAQARYEEGLAISERLARENPKSAHAQRDVSISYNKLGDTLRIAGNFGAAQQNYEKGLAIRERLARENPKSADAQRDVSISYERLGDVAEELKNLGLAVQRYEQSLRIAEALATANQRHPGLQRDYEITKRRLAELRAKAGR